MDLMFEKLRDNGRINISKGIEVGTIVKGEKELKGFRNKFWFNNSKYMFKEIFLDSYEDYAELISSEIAKELGIDCAIYDLAIFEGNFGVITENFVNEDIGEELISGTEVIYEVYQKHILPLQEICNKYFSIINGLNLESNFSSIYEFDLSEKQELLKEFLDLYSVSCVKSRDIINLSYEDIKKLTANELDNYLTKIHNIFKELNKMYDSSFIECKNAIIKANNLFDLWAVIDMYCKINKLKIENSDIIIKKLADLFLYDIITSQGDRHSDNWGLIVNKNDMSVRFSPIYDNSNMCNLNRSKTIKTFISLMNFFNPKKMRDSKEERIKNRLKEIVYHERSSLKVLPEDLLNRSNNIRMISEFIDISSIEIKNHILEIINKLSIECLLNIFLRIEQKTKILIPKQVKEVVIKTIEININEILCFLNKKEDKKNGK